jgi:hypothetical protein
VIDLQKTVIAIARAGQCLSTYLIAGLAFLSS